VSYLKGEDLFAELTIHLFEFNHHLLTMDFDCTLGLKPAFETFYVNVINCACAIARGDQRIEFPVLIYFFGAPTDAASILA
jgi:hypothetical protein